MLLIILVIFDQPKYLLKSLLQEVFLVQFFWEGKNLYSVGCASVLQKWGHASRVHALELSISWKKSYIYLGLLRLKMKLLAK